MRKNRGIRRWGLAGGALLLLVASVLVWNQYRMTINDWQNRLLNTTSLVAGQAEQALAAVDLITLSLVDQIERERPETPEALADFARQRTMFENINARASSLPQVDVVTITGPTGDILNFSRSFPAPKINLGDRDYFQAHLKNPALTVYLSEPVQNRGNGRWTFYVVRKVRSPSGAMIGAVLVGLRVEYFTNLYRQAQIGPGHSTLLFRKDGVVLARYPETAIGRSIANSPVITDILDRAPQGVLLTQAPRPFESTEPVNRIVAARSLDNVRAGVASVVTEDLFLAPWLVYAATVAAATLIGLLGLMGLIARLERGARERASAESALKSENGTLRSTLQEREKRVLGYEAEIGRMERLLQLSGGIDKLTGLADRNYLRQFLAALNDRTSPDAALSLVVIDLLKFANVNREYGHARGDMVLRGFAEFLRSECRPGDLVVRMGGDEFALVLTNCDPTQARTAAQRIRSTIESARLEGIGLQCSIGVSSLSARDDMDQLIELAFIDLGQDRGHRAATKAAVEFQSAAE